MFDLPTTTSVDLREYRYFRQYLIKSGYIMMQESIYTKLAVNLSACNRMKAQIKKNLPKDGLVQMLVITEKQFGDMEFLIGSSQTKYLDNDKRLVEL